MRLFLAILIGKLIAFFTRTFKIGGGSAAPGYYALKIDPNLVNKLAKNIPQNIIITGTNGKTTTARILAHIAKESGLNVIRNSTGSNLERGVASSLILNSALSALHSFDLGIWELDEAAFNSVAPKLKPDSIVFLNVFRDQMDRYGEIDTTIKKWCQTLKGINKNTKILINGDDENLLQLKNCFNGKTETFGLSDHKIAGELTHKKSLKTFLDYSAKNIKLDGLNGSFFELSDTDFYIPIPGIYHIYDCVAALILASHLQISLSTASKGLKNFSPAFGRVEKLPFGYIFLIKNPAGATQVFETIAPQLKSDDRLFIALNDNFADGTDVSWIWDADFETLVIPGLTRNPDKNLDPRSKVRDDSSLIVSGSRAYDLAVRLKYAGFEANQIKVASDLTSALKEAREGLKGQLFILPTYTALLDLQRILTKQEIKPEYWTEQT